MPTLVWLLAAVGAWLAAVCAICMLLTVAKRADARLHTPPRLRAELGAGGLALTDASGLSRPRIGAIEFGVREPPLAAPTTAIAAGGQADPPPWPRRCAGLDPASAHHDYRLYAREAPVAQLQWRVGPGHAAGWYLWQRREGWRRLAVDPALDADVDAPSTRPR